MKKLWSMMIMLAAFAIPAFAQLTPTDSTISGTITGHPVLNKNKVYLLSGFVKVDSLASITIPAGTVLVGEKLTQGSLIITRGGKIFANGTATEPIVFTSQQPSGLRSRGDWGGVVICGAATCNRPGNNFLVEGNIAEYAGGTDPHDNSGVMRYVRIEFPGIAYTPNNEINGLTLAAVGDGTIIEHIQVSYSGDDSYEWFGGTVNCKYLIAYKGLDDDLDTDFGFTGKIQFALVYRDPFLADVSNSEAFESDNDGTGTTLTPRTEPIFSNITVVGPKRNATDVSGTDYNSLFYYGIHHRRSSRHNLFNSVVMGFDEGGIYFDGTVVQGDTANFAYRNNVFTGMSKLVEPVSYNAWFSSYNNTLLPNPNDVLLKAPFNQSSPVCVPQTGSVLLSGASFSGGKISDPYFTHVSYRGAFSGNGAERWDLGWANYDPQGIYYGTENLDWSSIINITTGNGESRSVVIGRGSGATDGIDISFGESPLPPVPAPGIVDLRLDLPGSSDFVATDIRSNTTTSNVITYTLAFQPGSPSSVLTLSWDPNYLGAGKFTLKDGLGGLVFPNLDMKTASSQILTGLTTAIIEVDARYNQTLVVQNAWNLVSFPGIHPNSMTPDTLYRGRDITASVFRFNNGYAAVTSLVPGEGYWMKHSGIRTYNWNGTVQTGILYPKLNYAPRVGFAGNTGWNIIGGYDYNADVNFIRTMPENKRTGLVFQYVPGSGYVSAGSLTPGNGYWVNLTSAATIFVPGPFAGTLGKNPVDDLISSDWGRIIIADAIGQNYILYSSNSSVNLNNFNLPPLPPAGLFDVRFDSQRFVEDLSSCQTINLSGVVYPVTVKVEGMNVRIEDVSDGKIINTVLKNGASFQVANNLSSLKISSVDVMPTEYSLEQNYPNPFNPSTTIKFAIPEAGNVKLTIYNAIGQKVAEIVNTTMDAGSYSINWDASSLASGLYFYELNTNNFSSVKKMMLLK